MGASNSVPRGPLAGSSSEAIMAAQERLYQAYQKARQEAIGHLPSPNNGNCASGVDEALDFGQGWAAYAPMSYTALQLALGVPRVVIDLSGAIRAAAIEAALRLAERGAEAFALSSSNLTLVVAAFGRA